MSKKVAKKLPKNLVVSEKVPNFALAKRKQQLLSG